MGMDIYTPGDDTQQCFYAKLRSNGMFSMTEGEIYMVTWYGTTCTRSEYFICEKQPSKYLIFLFTHSDMMMLIQTLKQRVV